MTRYHLAVAAACALAAGRSDAQTTWREFPTARDRTQLERLIRAEDARARTDSDLATLRGGVRAENPALRRVAVRGLGRLERSEVVADVTPLLADRDASVRRAAADALAQSVSHVGGPAARGALLARAAAERDPIVVAAIAENLGRLQPANANEAGATGDTLVRISRQADRDAAPAVLRGVVRGLSFLTRRSEARGALSAATVGRLEQLIAFHRAALRAGGSADAGYIRALAAAALVASGAPTPADVERILTDPDETVREKGVARIGTFGDAAVVRSSLMRALADSAPIVRFRSIPVYARLLRASGCGPLVVVARDRNTHVALAGIDALNGCRSDTAALALLDSLAESLPRDGSWHRPAHAIVSLAAVAPERARGLMASFVASADPFVRTYAVRAARALGDTARLARLAEGDSDSNVRSEAIDALSAAVGHVHDAIYVSALESTDSQLLQSAAKALKGTPNPVAAPALFAALDRLSALRRETSRDARIVLLDAIRASSDSASAGRLRAYLTDFDPQVASAASELITAWTGTHPTVAVAPLPALALPPAATLGTLGDARVMIEMADGGTIVLRLFPLDAPSNAWRLVRLARAGYFDGLTWHRVVPFFVVQGGSPKANEYVGDGPFTRDEVGIENRRGTVGLSTRGRDTGDGQLYFNTVDNVRLDHDYTILAEVVSGMDVVDRIQEGARIKRVTVGG